MRRAIALLAFMAGLALVVVAGGPVQAQEGPPGFNGTVKIHDGDTESEPIRANEPHVGCTFHIHGFNFDPNSSGTWNIQSWPPTGDRSVVASGSWGPADGDGDWRTAVMSLPGGDHNQGAHYKLNVDQTSPSAPGGQKHKVFWVDCPPPAQVGAQASPTPTQLGVQQGPQGGVTPRVEGQQQAGAGAQAGAQVAGQQAAPVAALPSTSTAPMSPLLLSALLTGVGMWMMRRREGDI